MPNNNDWRNSLENVSYPFVEGILQDANGSSLFPLNLIVDAQFIVPAFVTGQIHLSSTKNSGVRLDLNFSADEDIGTVSVLAGDINNGSFPVISASGLQVGTVVFGPDAARARQKVGLGLKEYTSSQLFVEPSCVFRFPTTVLNRIDTPSGSARGKTALVEGAGIRLVKINDSLVRIDAVGDPEKVRDCCPVSGTPLRFLNDAMPDVNGGIQLNVEDFSEPTVEGDARQVLRIAPSAGKITFSINA